MSLHELDETKEMASGQDSFQVVQLSPSPFRVRKPQFRAVFKAERAAFVGCLAMLLRQGIPILHDFCSTRGRKCWHTELVSRVLN